jgi:hypothetical protein
MRSETVPLTESNGEMVRELVGWLANLYILEIPWFLRKHCGSTQMSITLEFFDLN